MRLSVGVTRINRSYMILHRDITKIHRLNAKTYILSGGMFADYQQFWKLLDARLSWYRMNHGEELSSTAIASLVSRMLYEKRFFPFYAFNLVVGFDDEDKPVIWNYDAVGSYGKVTYGVNGSSKSFILPFFDNQVGARLTAAGQLQRAAEARAEDRRARRQPADGRLLGRGRARHQHG